MDKHEELDVGQVIGRVWARKTWLMGIVATVTAISWSVTFLMSPVYRATTVLIPSNESGTGLSGLLGQMGGLTALAGIRMDKEATTAIEGIAILRSRQFLSDVIVERGLLQQMFSDDWDPAAKSWKMPDDHPTLWDGFQKFSRDVLNVAQDQKTGLVTLHINWPDPIQSADLANFLVKRVNAVMREQAIAEADATIADLRRELDSATSVELGLAISRVIEAQVKQRSLARVRQDYVFRVVDPAMPSDRDDPYSPNRGMFVLIGISTGIALGTLLVLWVPSRRRVA